MKRIATGLLLAWAMMGITARAQTPVNPDSAIIQEFEKRVSDYMQLRKNLESKIPRMRSTTSPADITRNQRELGQAIRDARKNARQGDVFTPPAAAEFRRLVGLAMQGAKNNDRIHRSMKSAEPVHIHLNVNDRYPSGIPLQSTPPTLLMNLPALPPELEFRLVGTQLVLLDSKAGIVVDIIPDVLSASPSQSGSVSK